MANQLETINTRFSIPGTLKFDTGQGGLIRAIFTTPHAQAHVYLHGAHVTHYQHTNQKPLLFLSKSSYFEPNKPIRGGVPICFPWFGPNKAAPSAPSHGFARLKEWTIESTAKADDGNVQLALSLASDASTRALWPHDFRAVYKITIGPELRLSLEIFNTGSSPFPFEEALHTYLTISDIKHVRVEGLEGTTYLDKLQDGKPTPQGPHPITFTSETDSIYLNTRAMAVVHDPAGQRNISIAKDGSETTVVWNPWINKAKSMPDFGDDEWPKMLCIETCNVDIAAVKLEAGKSHTMTAVIKGQEINEGVATRR